MPTQSAPQYTIAKPPHSKEAGPHAGPSKDGTSKTPTARLKIVIRRLPPGLSEKEFFDAIGVQWQKGNGKVDWSLFRPGKVSKDLAKLSRPARAYIHVTEPAHLDALSESFRHATFEDAKRTTKDPVLVGPPVLEFAQYQRIPNGRKRNDPRQGLIDQDSEFFQFLESLTNPVEKPANVDAQDTRGKATPTVVTPLIQYLRDKKAAKEKAAVQKAAKHSRQGSKGDTLEAKAAEKKSAAASQQAKAVEEVDPKKSTKRMKNDKSSAATTAGSAKKEPAVSSPTPQASVPVHKAASASANTGPVVASSESSARKAVVTAPGVARMIQRDLGIQARGSSRAARAGRPLNSENRKPDARTTPVVETSISAASVATNGTAATKLKATQGAESVASAAPASTPPADSKTRLAPAPSRATRANPVPSPASTQAFLKHANPSQGITEPLIEEALSYCGQILKVEIDKRKGFAFVNFADPLGLQKAMADSPIKVAQGSIQILERKDRGANPGRTTVAQPFSPPSGPAASRPQPPTAPSGRGARPARGGYKAGGGRGGGATNAAAHKTIHASAPANVTSGTVSQVSVPAAESAATERGKGT